MIDNFRLNQLKRIGKYLLLNTIETIEVSETSNDELNYDPIITIKVNRPYGFEIITLTVQHATIKTEYAVNLPSWENLTDQQQQQIKKFNNPKKPHSETA